MYVVTVTFTVKADSSDKFLPLMLANARQSLAEEPGCHTFDVCVDPDSSNTIFLYEVYDDRAAFDVHLASGHFKSFDRETASMITGKSVKVLTRVR